MAILQAPVMTQTPTVRSIPAAGVEFANADWPHIPYDRSEPCLVFLTANINNGSGVTAVYSLFPAQGTAPTNPNDNLSVQLASLTDGSIAVVTFVANPVRGEAFRVWSVFRTQVGTVTGRSGRLIVIPLTV